MPDPKIEGETYQYQAWPAWCDGPNGEREIFDSEAEVPAGWTHHVAAEPASDDVLELAEEAPEEKPALDL